MRMIASILLTIALLCPAKAEQLTAAYDRTKIIDMFSTRMPMPVKSVTTEARDGFVFVHVLFDTSGLAGMPNDEATLTAHMPIGTDIEDVRFSADALRKYAEQAVAASNAGFAIPEGEGGKEIEVPRRKDL